MTKPKKNAKLALKNQPVMVKHKGYMVKLINLSQRDRSCSNESCAKVLGRNQFLVSYLDKFYCNWACSNVAD